MESLKQNIIVVISLFVILLTSCDKNGDIINPDKNGYSNNYGTIQIDFPIEETHVPLRCIKRANLSIAYTADSLYREEYITVANTSDYQSLYEFVLEPGVYYFKAAKTCVCGRDTCLWGGYPGGQNGMLWSMWSFEVLSEKTSYIHINFN